MSESTPLILLPSNVPAEHVPIDWAKVQTIDDIKAVLIELRISILRNSDAYSRIKHLLVNEEAAQGDPVGPP